MNKILYIILLAAIAVGCNENPEAKVQNAHDEIEQIHTRMLGVHDSVRQEHKKWVENNGNSNENQRLEEQHEAIFTKYAELNNEHGQLVKKHLSVLQNSKLENFTEEEVDQHLIEVKDVQKRMESEFKRMLEDYRIMHEEHQRLAAEAQSGSN